MINTWFLKSATNRNKIESIDVTDTLDTLSNPEKKENKKNFSVLKCDLVIIPDLQEQSIYIS